MDSDPESEFDFNDLDGKNSKSKRRGRVDSQARKPANILESLQAEQINRPPDGRPPMKIVKQVEKEKE